MEKVMRGKVFDVWGNHAARQPDEHGKLALALTELPIYVEVPGKAEHVRASCHYSGRR